MPGMAAPVLASKTPGSISLSGRLNCVSSGRVTAAETVARWSTGRCLIGEHGPNCEGGPRREASLQGARFHTKVRPSVNLHAVANALAD